MKQNQLLKQQLESGIRILFMIFYDSSQTRSIIDFYPYKVNHSIQGWSLYAALWTKDTTPSETVLSAHFFYSVW